MGFHGLFLGISGVSTLASSGIHMGFCKPIFVCSI